MRTSCRHRRRTGRICVAAAIAVGALVLVAYPAGDEVSATQSGAISGPAQTAVNTQALAGVSEASSATFNSPSPSPSPSPSASAGPPIARGVYALVHSYSNSGPVGAVLVDGCSWATWVGQCQNLSAYGNGGSFGNTNCGPPFGCTFGPEFQCTQLVWRYAHYAWGEPDTWGGNAQTFWNAGPQLPLPLQQFPNGGGVAPRQGDIMVFGPGWLGSYWDGAGHVAVVRDVGSNYVDVVEQNATASGTDRFALSGSRVTANGYTPLTGWLRNTTQVPVELQPRNVAGTPQTVSDRSGEADVLWRGTDNRLWTIGYRNLRWAPQSTAITTSNNVPLASDPTVVSTGPGKIDAFWQGNDSNLWHSHYTAGYFGSGSWSLPDSLSSGSSVQSAPSAVSVGGGAVDIFWKGPGGTLYADRYNGTNSSFLPISGTALVSTPYAVAIGNGAAEVFWRGSGNNLWSDTVTPWASGSPRLLAWAALGSDPAPVSDGQGNVDVFWRGSDGTLWHMAQTSGSWRATGQISSQPIVGNTTAVETSPGSITAVVQRTDGDLAAAVTIPSGGFVGPELLGDGPVGSNPTAVAYSQSAIYVYWRGLDSGLWYSPACPGCGQVPSVGTALS